jgi:hypothetical protein
MSIRQIIRSNEDALAAFVSRKAEIDAMLARLQALSADHFGYVPDDVTLGSLTARGLIDHQGTPRGDDPPPLRITRAGLQAIGVETEDAPEGATPGDTGTTVYRIVA